ncbi:MAG: hypothetical protein WB383_04420 [Acidimicrobiales bacterium]
MTDELDRRRDQAESEAKRRREAEASAEDDSYRTAARIRQEVGAALPSDLVLRYRIERLGHPTSGAIADVSSLSEHLNTLGADRWELVAMVPRGDDTLLIFKKWDHDKK